MRMPRKFALSAIAALSLSLGAAPIAYADDYYPPKPPDKEEKQNCNAGNGNGNEGCDPGNSAPQNRGGDEIGATTAEGGSTPNPGGNNVFAD